MNIHVYIMRLRFLLCLYYLINVTLNFSLAINLWKKYDKLRKKINKILNKEQDSNIFLDLNEFEYPKANETLRIIHKQSWQEYYECLKKTYAEIGLDKVIHPIALGALEGTSVMLKCEICISPIEAYMSDNIEWYFNNGTNNNKTNKVIEESDNICISPEDKKLKIYNIKSEQAGQYWCELMDILSPSYYLSVDTDSQAVKIVHPATAPNMPHAIPEKIIPEYNIIIHTTWTTWSPCSKCNKVGKKNRYGYCTISLRENIINQKQDLQDYKRQVIENGTSDAVETTIENETFNENIISKVTNILRIFRNKLPCKSKYLPKEILDIPEVSNRKTEMMVRYCKIKCLQNVIFEVRDKQGNVLESANNSAGIFSIMQGMPIPSPLVIRTIVYQKYNKEIEIICPGNLHTNVPIIWKRDNKTLNPSVIEDQSQGRIYMNTQMHIIFKSLKFEDADIYSCWQKDEIAGVVKLNVIGEIELEMNYSVIMIGGILIVIVFLIVFWRAFHGRRRFTIH